MKNIFWFLLGFTLSLTIGLQSSLSEYCPALGDSTQTDLYQTAQAYITAHNWGTSYLAYGGIATSTSDFASFYATTGKSYQYWVDQKITGGKIYGKKSNASAAGLIYILIPNDGVCPEPVVSDSDGDGIPDGLDAYPDTDCAYQFRIMTNYFDSDGNCVGQLIVTSSGDYVLLGNLTAAEIEAGVSAGTYKSDFVNSPIWIDSSDLEDDNASDIYASGDSTTPVNSTTASGLTSSATTADANDLSTADGVTAGSTYDSGSDTDSSALGKIVDNTAAATSNQQTLANYAKKQSELQSTGNALLGQINDTLKNQSDSDSFEFDEQGAETAKSEFNNLSVSNYYSADDYNGTLTPETDYDEAQDLEDVSWFTDFFSNNPLKTAFNSSGFELSSGACEVSYTIDGWGTYNISLCEFSSAFETAGNLLFSLTSLLSLIIIAWR